MRAFWTEKCKILRDLSCNTGLGIHITYSFFMSVRLLKAVEGKACNWFCDKFLKKRFQNQVISLQIIITRDRQGQEKSKRPTEKLSFGGWQSYLCFCRKHDSVVDIWKLKYSKEFVLDYILDLLKSTPNGALYLMAFSLMRTHNNLSITSFTYYL